jgi:hypothetical protein
MLHLNRTALFAAVLSLACFTLHGSVATAPQPLDQAEVIRRIDAAVALRVNSIAGYTVTEHYAVFHGDDQAHSTAEMTVKTTYKKDAGKTYDIVSESGSAMIRRLGLDPILASEKEINLPGNVEKSWIISANYEMTVKPGGVQRIDGRDCLVLSINPKRKATNLIVGNLWVDAQNFTIVRLEGVASKAPSIFAGSAHVMRQYANIDGFAMATHAHAESSTFLYGKTVVTIDYSNYSIQHLPGK